MAPTITDFRFKIEEAVEISGQIRHWTIVIGQLKYGRISVGQQIKIPTTSGSVISRIWGFEAFRVNLGATVEACTFRKPFGIVTHYPVVEDSIVLPEMASDVKSVDYQASRREIFKCNPSVFLHYRSRDKSKYPWLCGQCASGLLQDPELRAIVLDLASQGDAEMSALAQKLFDNEKKGEESHHKRWE